MFKHQNCLYRMTVKYIIVYQNLHNEVQSDNVNDRDTDIMYKQFAVSPREKQINKFSGKSSCKQT